jgi:hypothetical protein
LPDDCKFCRCVSQESRWSGLIHRFEETNEVFNSGRIDFGLRGNESVASNVTAVQGFERVLRMRRHLIAEAARERTKNGQACRNGASPPFANRLR